MKDELKKIGDAFLESPEDPGAVWRTCRRYKDLLMELTFLDLDGEQERTNLGLEKGIALGPAWAALCLDDFLRTKRFINGIYQAVKQLRQSVRDRSIHMLYAGTGPYATLILPLTQFFTPDEIQFTLLEINPISFQNLEKVIRNLGIEDYVREVKPADATQYLIPEDEPVDIILSETMQAGLRKEAQVPIFQHLSSQPGARGAILIPERIELFLGVFVSGMSTSNSLNRTLKFDSYFRLDRHEITRLNQSASEEDYGISEIKIPDSLDTTYDKLAIFTEIDIFKDQQLRFNESGLTVPLLVRDLRYTPAAGETIRIGYSLQNEPGEVIAFKNQIA